VPNVLSGALANGVIVLKNSLLLGVPQVIRNLIREIVAFPRTQSAVRHELRTSMLKARK